MAEEAVYYLMLSTMVTQFSVVPGRCFSSSTRTEKPLVSRLNGFTRRKNNVLNTSLDIYLAQLRLTYFVMNDSEKFGCYLDSQNTRARARAQHSGVRKPASLQGKLLEQDVTQDALSLQLAQRRRLRHTR